jgi:hypothetical protein
MLGSADVAMAPNGTIYVSWVDNANDVHVARSTDGGASFGPAAPVDDGPVEPLVSMARHPYVVADNDRVAVALNDQGGTVYLYVADASDALSFSQGMVIGGDVPTMFRDFPKPIFLGDGNLAVAFHGYPTSGGRVFVSRESNGFASEPASSGAPGVPCDCCPEEIAVLGGDLVVAFRNNDNNVREMWVATAPGSGTFSNWVAGSSSEGVVNSCPMQGPRLAESGSSRFMVWSARGSSVGAAYLSVNNGAGWSGGAPVGGFMADEPTIAIGASGRIFVTGITGSAEAALTWSDDGGANWNPPEALAAPDGALSTPQAEGGAGIAALAGVSGAGSVWLLRME